MRDDITALAFDNAVMTFGVWADNRLAEYDTLFKQPKYTLEQILDIEPDEQRRIEMNAASVAAFRMMAAVTRGGALSYVELP
jgi:hypothetical protein